MPGKILGLDLTEEVITAVQVKSGLKGYEITACARVMVNGDGGMEGALAELERLDLKSDLCFASIPGERLSFRNLHMPFSEPKKIRQTLPFEIETLVPFPIGDVILDFHLNPHLSQNEILAVGVQRAFISEYLQELQNHGIDPDALDVRCVSMIAWLMQQKETPKSGIFLDIGDRKATLILYVEKQIALIRTLSIPSPAPPEDEEAAPDGPNGKDGEQAEPDRPAMRFQTLCTLVQNTLHALTCQSNQAFEAEKVFFSGSGAVTPQAADLLNRHLSLPAEQIDLARDSRIHMDPKIAGIWDAPSMDGALALALREPRKAPGFNFRKDEFELTRHHSRLKREFKKAGVFAFILVILLGGYVGVDYVALEKRTRELDRKITAVFRKTFPETQRIRAPLQQMKVKVNELKNASVPIPGMNAGTPVLLLLKDISERVPAASDVRVIRMVIDPETVRISGRTDTFNTVDTVKNGLEPSPYFESVSISSANLDRSGKQVQFEIKLERAK